MNPYYLVKKLIKKISVKAFNFLFKETDLFNFLNDNRTYSDFLFYQTSFKIQYESLKKQS